MFDWIRKQFTPPEIQTIPLIFTMDRTGDGQHLVQVLRHQNGQGVPVTNLDQMWHYGYQEREEAAAGDIIYVLDSVDRQTLLSLRRLNPQQNGDGRLLFDFAPPILSYLRTKENLAETELSRKLQVRKAPFTVTAHIDFDAQEGLTISTGYQDPETEEMIPIDTLSPTKDGRYLLIGDTFTPLPPPPSEKAKAWWGTIRIPKSDIPEFFLRDLVLLKKEFNAVLTGGATEIQIIESPFRPLVTVDKDRRGWLDFDIGYEVNEFTLSHQLLGQHPADAYIQVDAHTWVKKDAKAFAQTEKELASLNAQPTEQGYRTPISQFATLDEFVADIGGRAELGAAYQSFLDQLTGFEADETFQLSPAAEQQLQQVDVTLRPYQRAGIHWLTWLYHNYLHGLLADDLGLGKTLQAICLLQIAYEQAHSQQHSLIMAPKSVLHHWERELQRFFPGMQVYAYHGANRQRQRLQSEEPIIFISTYQTVTNDVDTLKLIPFFYIILDEASHIKNPNTNRSRAIKALNSAHRLALSGRPVENRPAELWSIFDFLIKGYLGFYGTFQRVYEKPIGLGEEQASERLGKRIRPFMLRRLKEEVAQDLPEKIPLDEWCELSQEQRLLYGQVIGQAKEMVTSLQEEGQVNVTMNILPILQKLKQICDHPAIVTGEAIPLHGRSEKFDWIIRKVKEIDSQGEQLVIFTHFLGMLDLMQTALDEESISHIRIDGSTNKRQRLIDQFNEGQAAVALCSIKATAYGINLTSANHVIHADRWWNPATEDQATDRVHRIGQDKTVYVYWIMVQGTLEERIEDLLESKRQMAGQIVDAATAEGQQWTRDELLELLRPLD